VSIKKTIPSAVPARLKAALDAGDDYGATDPPDWREINWDDHLNEVQIAGRSVSYVDIGEQGEHRPMVFIHGLSGQWQNWFENIPRFAAARRVIAMDLPGFGRSEMPEEPISIEVYGRVVAELLEHLDVAPAVLIGNSMGGFVAAEVATRRSELVERLMLLSSAGISQMEVAKRPVLVGGKVAGFLVTSGVAQMRMAAARPRLRHLVMMLICRHPSLIKPDAMFEGLMKGANKPGFDDALRACLEYDFRERLADIGCPTIVVWGEKDMIIPVRDADQFVGMIDGARKVIFEDTGHVPMFERPKAFNDCLEAFLHHEVAEGELEGELDGTPEGDSASGETVPADAARQDAEAPAGSASS
jgi:pimeloyl-ACP methyl ester carboxylesterase